MIPHNTPVRREKVAIRFNNKKIGDGTVSENGTLTVLLTDTSIGEMMAQGAIQHISIDPTYKQ